MGNNPFEVLITCLQLYLLGAFTAIGFAFLGKTAFHWSPGTVARKLLLVPLLLPFRILFQLFLGTLRMMLGPLAGPLGLGKKTQSRTRHTH